MEIQCRVAVCFLLTPLAPQESRKKAQKQAKTPCRRL